MPNLHTHTAVLRYNADVQLTVSIEIVVSLILEYAQSLKNFTESDRGAIPESYFHSNEYGTCENVNLVNTKQGKVWPEE